jgi:predicted ATPase
LPSLENGRTNLPAATTSFIGRERELAEVLDHLSRDDVRLLTLTGPGGTGKTRLATQAAGELVVRYGDGVWWVPLAALRDPRLVLEGAAQVLGVKDGLADHIGDKSMLLVLDNFEQVVEAAAGLADLLASCNRLELLVTSREPLHITGEQKYVVPPLVHEEAIRFFLARAGAVDSGFQATGAVSEICRRLDDLPLALELAAGRVRVASPAQILQRLEQRLALLTGGPRDLADRQRTLRATIAWSHDLLGPEEQRLFARLSVFRGGCTLQTAEQVCEAELDMLQALVNKSLLQHAGERYWLLETIREYAAERLEASPDADKIACRHAEHFLRLAEETEPEVRVAGNPREPLERLAHENDNLRAALDRFQFGGETQAAPRLAGALLAYWNSFQLLPEGRRHLTLTLAADQRPTAARAKALAAAALAELHGGDPSAASLRAEEARALHQELGDAWGVARSMWLLGRVALEVERDLPKAQRLFEESAGRFASSKTTAA